MAYAGKLKVVYHIFIRNATQKLQNNYKNFGEIKKGVSRMLTPHKEVI